MSDKKLAVIKAGDTFTEIVDTQGDFEDWIIQGLGVESDLCLVVNAEKKETLPDPDSIAGAVISGSHAMVTESLDWSLALESWTRKMVKAEVPLLGICYGHQILAKAMGGIVDFHPKGAEVGTTEITRLPEGENDALFGIIPDTFWGHVVHSQSVIELPEKAILLAENEFEPHHGFRIGKAAWGVQFHPEFDSAATSKYIRFMAEKVKQQGQDPEDLVNKVEATPWSAALLKEFATLVFGK